MKLLSLPKFSNIDSNDFFKTLNKRVNDYFKESKIRKTGNWKLYLKTVIIFSMFIGDLFLGFQSHKLEQRQDLTLGEFYDLPEKRHKPMLSLRLEDTQGHRSDLRLNLVSALTAHSHP